MHTLIHYAYTMTIITIKVKKKTQNAALYFILNKRKGRQGSCTALPCGFTVAQVKSSIQKRQQESQTSVVNLATYIVKSG